MSPGGRAGSLTSVRKLATSSKRGSGNRDAPLLPAPAAQHAARLVQAPADVLVAAVVQVPPATVIPICVASSVSPSFRRSPNSS